MTDLACLNARADECSVLRSEGGRRMVRYRGEEFAIVGLYFANLHDGELELCYILREAPDERRD